uniref:Leucine-rich repeat-containing N-terminal plant-type domain-containing protein n=1 Tax=Cannabis sativa TaxID=3483 RepID=A0A803QII3_CANSA
MRVFIDRVKRLWGLEKASDGFIKGRSHRMTFPSSERYETSYRASSLLAEDRRNVGLAVRDIDTGVKNWQGDPCGPKTYIWDGLNCSFNGEDDVRIISLNLSGNNLTGSVPRELIQKSNSGSLMLRDLPREKVTVEVIDWADLRADFFDSSELNLCPNLHKSLSRPP